VKDATPHPLPERCCFRSVDMDISYQTEGSGPVLTCLHGGKGNSGDYFIPYLSPLGDEMKLVYLDERGSGKSKPVPDISRVSYPGLTEDMENLIRHLGVEQIGLLGHSFGGALAINFTLRYPHRVRELYLVGGGTSYPGLFSRDGWWGEVFDAEMKRLNVADQVKAVCDEYNSGKITADESFRRQVLLQAPSIIYHWPQKREEVLETFARTDFTYLGPEHCNFGDENAVHAEMFSRLGEIACPTLLLPGQHDVSTPLEAMGGMARTIPDCEVKVIPRARHFPFIDEPEVFIAAIRQFRAEHGLAG